MDREILDVLVLEFSDFENSRSRSILDFFYSRRITSLNIIFGHLLTHFNKRCSREFSRKILALLPFFPKNEILDSRKFLVEKSWRARFSNSILNEISTRNFWKLLAMYCSKIDKKYVVICIILSFVTLNWVKKSLDTFSIKNK